MRDALAARWAEVARGHLATCHHQVDQVATLKGWREQVGKSINCLLFVLLPIKEGFGIKLLMETI